MISRPQKKKRAACCGDGLLSCLHNRFLRKPRCAKTHLEKLKCGVGLDLTDYRLLRLAYDSEDRVLKSRSGYITYIKRLFYSLLNAF